MDNEQTHDDLSPEEQARYDALPRAHPSSESLDRSVVQTLRTRGLINAPTDVPWTWPRFIGRVAAAILLLAVGYGLGHWQATTPVKISDPQTPSGPVFGLFLYSTPASEEDTPGILDIYQKWIQSINFSERWIEPARLENGGVLLQAEKDEVKMGKVDGYAMRGYFLIEAKGYDDAIGVARTLPHLKFGGTVEVRQMVW